MNKFSKLLTVFVLTMNVLIEPLIAQAEADQNSELVSELVESLPIESSVESISEIIESPAEESIFDEPTLPVEEESPEVPVESTSIVEESSIEIQESIEESSDTESVEDEVAITTIQFEGIQDASVTQFKTGSNFNIPVRITNSQAVLNNVTLRLTVPAQYIDYYSNSSDYFNGALTPSRVTTENNQLIVEYVFSELSDTYNQLVTLALKTKDDGSIPNNTLIPVKVELINENTTISQTGTVNYQFVTRQPQFRTNVTYPSEPNDDSVQRLTEVEFYFSLADQGQGNGSGKSAIKNILVKVEVSDNLTFDAANNEGWSFDEVSRLATYTFNPEITNLDTEVLLPNNLILINNEEAIDLNLHAQAYFTFANGDIIEATRQSNTPIAFSALMVEPLADLSDYNFLDSIVVTLNPGKDNEQVLVSGVNEINVKDTDTIGVDLSFSIPDSITINPGDIYVAPISDLMKLVGLPDEVIDNLPLTNDFGDLIGTVSLTNGELIVTFSDIIDTLDNRVFNINFAGDFKDDPFENGGDVVINIPLVDDGSYELIFRPEQEAYTGTDKKEASNPYVLDGDVKNYTNRNPEYADWTVRANDSMGSFTSATIIDDVGANQEIVPGSFIVERIIRNYANVEIGRETVDIEPTITASGFELNLGAIEDAYEITYTTRLLRPDGGGNLTVNNNARIILDETTKNVSDSIETSWSGDIPTLTKSGNQSQSNVNVIEWQVEYNYGRENLGADVTLTDVLSTVGEQGPGAIDINSIKVQEVVTDVDGDVTDWGTVIEVHPSVDESGQVTIPAIDANGRSYYITFTSSIPFGSNGEIVNTISDNIGNQDDASVTVNTIPDGDKIGEQKVDAEGHPYIEWKVTINSKKVDVQNISVTDVFNGTYLDFDANDSSLYELLIDGSEVGNYTVNSYTHADGRVGFTLNITDAGPNTYTFVYRTYYTVAGMQQPDLANDAELIFNNGEGTDLPGVTVDFEQEGPKAGVRKWNNGYKVNSDSSNQEIEWVVEFNNSKILLETGDTLTDNFVSANFSLIDGSIQVLENGTDITGHNDIYSISTSATGFVLTLNKDTNATYQIVFRTTTDDTDNLDHKNEATLVWRGGTESADSSLGKRDPGISKTGNVVINEDGTKSINWVIDFNTNQHVIYDFVLTDTYTPATVTVSDIKIMSGETNETVNFTISPTAGGSFTVTANNRLDAKAYQLTYTTTLSPTEEVEEIKNTAAITYRGGNDSAEKTIAPPTIGVSKSVGDIDKVEDKSVANDRINWKIIANTDTANHLVNLVGAVLSDEIPADQKLDPTTIVVKRVGGDVLTGLPMSYDDNSFAITLPDGPYQYEVTFQTEILFYPSVNDQIDLYTNTTTLTNTNHAAVSDSAEISYFYDGTNNDIDKVGVFNQETENIDWDIELNALGLRIPNARITDDLNETHAYLPDSFKIMDGSGNELDESAYTLSIKDSNKRFEITFPSDLTHAVRISYSTRANAEQIGTYKASNSVKLFGGDGKEAIEEGNSDVQERQWSFGGGGSGTSINFVIYKKNTLDEPIANTTFEFVRLLPNGITEVPIGGTLTTDDLGYIHVNNVRAGRYIGREVSTPNAYQKLEEPIYLIIGYSATVPGGFEVSVTDSSWEPLKVGPVTATGNEVTITNQFKTRDISATKSWQPGTLNEGSHPETWLKLYRRVFGQDEEAVSVELKRISGNNPTETVTWSGLEEFSSTGERYDYFVREVNAEGEPYTPAGYTKVENGLTVTNTNIETVTINGEKTWVDYENAHNTRPNYIVVRLLRNGQLFQEKTISSQEDWKYSFANLTKYDENGSLYNYSITEIVPNHYEMSLDAFNLVNTYDVSDELTEVHGQKVWDDWNDLLGKRPDDVTVYLFQNGEPYPDADNQVSMLVNEASNWEFGFTELPKYDNAGIEYTYSVTEGIVEGYQEANINGFTITNTVVNDATTSINGEKIWDDWDDLLGKRPEEVTISIFQNGEAYPDADNQLTSVASEATEWKYNFNELPKYDANGNLFNYTVAEEVIEGYELLNIVDFNLTNKVINDATTSVEVKKLWDDYDNKFEHRPESIVVYLRQNDVNFEYAIVDSNGIEGNEWSHEFTNLPKYDNNGQEFTYTIHEVIQSPYTQSIDQNTNTITNTYVNTETVNFQGQKVWNDYNNDFNTRPESITVTLYQNDVAMDGAEFTQTVSPDVAGNWNFSFNDLPKYDAEGEAYTYSVKEVAVEGYETTYSENFIVNTVDPLFTAVSGQKFWEDYNDQFETRPESITVNLLQNGVVIDSVEVKANDEGNWFYSFTDLNIHDENGQEYVYTIEEVLDAASSELYDSVVDGFDIYNTYVNTETVDIQGQKVWDDYNNQFNTRPASILLVLYRNDAVLENFVLSPSENEDGTWAFSFTDLPKYDELGQEYTYRVEELVNTPYTSVKTGSEEETVTFTNTYVNTEVVDFSGNKVWNDFENFHGLRPASININLYQSIEGEAVGDPIDFVSVDTSTNWSYLFEDLAKYDSLGNEYIYSVSEDVIPGYDSSVNGSTITNTLQTMQVDGEKVWNDFDNQFDTRPAYITLNLMQTVEGSDIAPLVLDTQRVTAVDDWAYTFTNLPIFNSEGVEFIYSIEEVPVVGYESNVDGYDIYNELLTTEVSGVKVWEGADNLYTTAPESITVNLVQTHTGSNQSFIFDSKVVTADDDWEFEFTNLPMYTSNGVAYSYSVTENLVPGYETDIDGTTITNSLMTIDLEGTKTWVDWFDQLDNYDNQLTPRPDSTQVNLLQNGNKITDVAVTPDTDGNWNYRFTNLPQYDMNGNLYNYTVEEEAVENYVSTTNGKDIVNTYQNTETVNLDGQKVWVDYENKHDTRPENIAVYLYQNGEVFMYQLITDDGNGDNVWSYQFTNLPKYDENGQAFAYVVDEIVTAPYTKAIDGLTITNTYVNTETVNFQGQKVWNDYNNDFNTRPESITVTLYQNDVAMDGAEFTQTVSPDVAGNWNFSFNDLPKYDAEGEAYTYSVKEVAVEGYETTYSENFIVNTVDPLFTAVSGQKFWEDYNDQFETRPESITVNLLRNGEFFKDVEVTPNDEGNWFYSFTDLNIHDENGQEYVYTIEEELDEDASKLYTSQVDGFNIYNSYVNTETVDVEGQKVWDDYNNQFSTRPASILLVLYRNGVEQSVIQVTPTDNSNVWTFEVNDLPKYDELGQAYEYELREVVPSPYTSVRTITDDGQVIFTNTYVNTDVTSLNGSKVWEDFDDYYGLRPDSIEVSVLQNGQVFDTKTVSVDRLGNWRYQFTGLPMYDELGEEYTYSVVDDVPAYEMEAYYDDLINTLVTLDVNGEKVWNDKDDQYGLRPDAIKVNLNQTVEGSDEVNILFSRVISADDHWSFSFYDIPKFDASGNEYIYFVTEEATEGNPIGAYDVVEDGYNLINNLITIDIPVAKTWNDFDNQYGLRPDTITYHLMQNDELFDSVTVSSIDDWSHVFESVPKFDAEGNEYNYKVVEEAVPAYDTTIDGYNVINSLITKDIEGNKIWDDFENIYGLRPESITVNLVQSVEGSQTSNVLATQVVTADDDWQFVFADVPVFDDQGNEYVYTLTEKVDIAYKSTVDNESNAITNTLKVIDIIGTKTWDDADNQDGVRPESLVVTLLADGEEVDRQEVSGDGNVWDYAFTNLPVYRNGEEVVYTVIEALPTGYSLTSEVGTFDLINHRTPDETSVTVTKQWDDADNQDGIRPESVVIQLMGDFEPVGEPVEVSGPTWTHTWTNLPVNAAGQPIVYTVDEVEVPEGYSTTVANPVVDGNSIIVNRHTPEVRDIVGTKTWDDNDNQYGARPDSLDITLLADGEEIDSVVLNGEGNVWDYTFTNLPVYKDGQKIVYTVTEEVIVGYDLTSNEDNFDLVNKLKPRVSVGDYVWEDVNKDGLQDETDIPLEGVILTIVDAEGNPVTDVFGNPVGPQTTDGNGYYSFDNLPIDNTYTVRIDRDAFEKLYPELVPTIEGAGDRTNDSSTWEATSVDMVEDGQRDPTLDFGFIRPSVSVGDYVWEDVNKDGLQDETDIPLEGVILTIVDAEGNPVTDVFGNPVGPQTTDGNGYYSFDNLPIDNTYTVRIDRDAFEKLYPELVPTIEGAGDRTNDSSTWEATSVDMVEDGQRDPTLDFGFIRPSVSVGDYVWEDVNKDGLQDETDIPLEGVILTIVDAEGNPVTDVFGNPVGPQITDGNGYYSFDNLPIDNTYTVRIDRDAFEKLYPELVPTIEGAGDRTNDSSTWEATSEDLTVDEQRDPTLDFGFIRPSVSVGDYVWEDVNKDGLQDETDIPLEGVILTIVDAEGNPVTDVFGNPVGPQITDGNGYYSFDNLPIDNTYTVRIDRDAFEKLYPELVPTIEGAGDRANDSSTWEATSVDMVEDGQRDPTLDFGFIRPSVSVGDYVWEDVNKDGLQDETDIPLEGVILTIVDAEGNPVTDVFGNPVGPQTTDENGYYSFDNLPIDNTYTVRIDRDAFEKLYPELVPTIEGAGDRANDSSTWEATSVELTEDGQRDPTLDFGFVRKPVEPEKPVDPEKPKPEDPKPADPDQTELPSTGEESIVWLASVVLVLGVMLLYVGDRSRKVK
ncbi:Cna B-type domain-containing protein [Fundicoccus culcitae]|uniref:Cna B-type domain-containing protein n=1 Tax=Fundicoccus culcitae TaxID=2969821 RepID=UPI0028BD4307|nr:Cna B-type domain-containing protein [Fundicoccus culcitae]